MLYSGYRVDSEQEYVPKSSITNAMVMIIYVPRYAGYVQEFKSIFRMDQSTEVYFAAGNEDIG